MTKNIKTPKKVLCVFAHPDDVDFSSAGTLAKWSAKGSEITLLVCTDGSKGSQDLKMTSAKLAKIRMKEQRDAGKILGVKDVIFLSHKDGELFVDLKLKEDISKIIRQVRPDVVITTDPLFLYSTKRGFVNHSDHRAAGQAAIDAVFPLARDRLNFPHHEKEGIGPHKVKTLLLVSFEDAEHYEDITKTISKKIEALQQHRSQVGGNDFAQRMRERSKMFSKKSGFQYAEGFKKIDLA
ncbi:MAG: PIG-L family deacetylase [Patescibacteria group bacterium]|nr:PIG-L family deacetylase [Patescibacteria group bacterium]